MIKYFILPFLYWDFKRIIIIVGFAYA
jgi:hypothetical protein